MSSIRQLRRQQILCVSILLLSQAFIAVIGSEDAAAPVREEGTGDLSSSSSRTQQLLRGASASHRGLFLQDILGNGGDETTAGDEDGDGLNVDQWWNDLVGDIIPTCRDVTAEPVVNLTAFAENTWYIQAQSQAAFADESDRCLKVMLSPRQGDWILDLKVDYDSYMLKESNLAVIQEMCLDFNRYDIATNESMPGDQLRIGPCWSPSWIPGLWSDYWIVDYVEGEEGYAIVSGGGQPLIVSDVVTTAADGAAGGETIDEVFCKTPDILPMSGLWIMTRTQNPDSDFIDELYQRAASQGFDTRDVVSVNQNACEVGETDMGPNGDCQDLVGLLDNDRDCAWVGEDGSIMTFFRCLAYGDMCPVTCDRPCAATTP